MRFSLGINSKCSSVSLDRNVRELSSAGGGLPPLCPAHAPRDLSPLQPRPGQLQLRQVPVSRACCCRKCPVCTSCLWSVLPVCRLLFLSVVYTSCLSSVLPVCHLLFLSVVYTTCLLSVLPVCRLLTADRGCTISSSVSESNMHLKTDSQFKVLLGLRDAGGSGRFSG